MAQNADSTASDELSIMYSLQAVASLSPSPQKIICRQIFFLSENFRSKIQI